MMCYQFYVTCYMSSVAYEVAVQHVKRLPVAAQIQLTTSETVTLIFDTVDELNCTTLFKFICYVFMP